MSSAVPAVRSVDAAPAAAASLPRVLYAIVLDPSQKFGSLEEQILLLGRAFQEGGSLFLPLFLVPPVPGKLARCHDAGLPAECLDLGRFRVRRLIQLLRLIRRERIDIVHWNFTPVTANPYLWALTLLAPRLRHYYTDHISRGLPLPAPARGLRRVVVSLLHRRYGRVLCVSRFVQDCLVRQGSWANLVHCPHFINTERFRPDPATRASLRSEYGVENKFVILTIAYLIEAKGVGVLCRAAVHLPADCEVWIVGDGPQREALRRLCDELRLAKVRFLGNQAQVQPYLQAADCFVCPSRWAEAAGLVNLEALATGLPVVASNIGGIPEYVEDGRTGLLFTPGDSDDLARCLRRLAGDASLCRAMGREARAVAVARFSPESRLGDYLDQYR
jgi:glycosyltransferase involved in cell wall biosynthesis